jgi:hypothetical protein
LAAYVRFCASLCSVPTSSSTSSLILMHLCWLSLRRIRTRSATLCVRHACVHARAANTLVLFTAQGRSLGLFRAFLAVYLNVFCMFSLLPALLPAGMTQLQNDARSPSQAAGASRGVNRGLASILTFCCSCLVQVRHCSHHSRHPACFLLVNVCPR